MQEFLDYIYYVLSYLQMGQFTRQHPIGGFVFATTFITVIVLIERSLILFFQIKKNNISGKEEKERLLNYHIRRIIMYAIVILFFVFRLMRLATPVFYN